MGKLSGFTVIATMKIDCDLEISAESLEDALEKGRKLNVTDFINFLGGYNDGECEITGVFQ